MRFLVDAQLPPALARPLIEHGHVAEHVGEIGPGDAPDRDLWRCALEHDLVIVTKDEDVSGMVIAGGKSPFSPNGVAQRVRPDQCQRGPWLLRSLSPRLGLGNARLRSPVFVLR